jgi:hypothetical protein
MWWLLLSLLRILGPQNGPPVVQQGLASGYTPYAREWARVGSQRVQVSSGKPYCAWFGYEGRGHLVLAHRSWPCGTRVLVWCPRTRRGTWGVVMDRGPYGAVGHRVNGLYCGLGTEESQQWCVKRPRRMVEGVLTAADPGRWRGIADLSPELRILIDHDGWEYVRLITTHKEIHRAWDEFKRRQPSS